ncbi:MAG: hypothetical protein V1731_01945 [Candidatus Aenigmatarchaeota archaeon]
MKGSILARDFLIYIMELAIVLFSLYFIATAGAAFGEYVFSFDERVLQDTLFSMQAAAQIAQGNFESRILVSPNPYTLKVGKDGDNYYVDVVSSLGIFRDTKVTQKVLPVDKTYLVSLPGNNINAYEGEFSEEKDTSVWVTKQNNPDANEIMFEIKEA